MKAPKLKIDAAALQNLALQHVEKFVLSVVVLLAVYLIYAGYSTPGGAEGDPVALQKTSLEVQQYVTQPSPEENKRRWEQIAEKRPVSNNVAELVLEGGKATDYSPYKLSNRWRTPDYPKLSTRVDPRLFPPLHLKVTVLTGPIASQPKPNELDPLGEPVFPSDAQTPANPVRPPPPRRQPPAAGPPGEGGPGPGRGQRPPRGVPGDLLGGPGPGFIGGAGMPQPQPGMPAAPGGVNPEAIRGFFPTGPAYARDCKSAVVMAVVPYDDQLAEFEKVFENALDYDELRDVPRYITFLIERADVTADPAVDPAKAAWSRLDLGAAIRDIRTWAGFPTELVEPKYLDPILTHPAPPLLQRDLWDALTHPELSLASALAAPGEALAPGENPAQPAEQSSEFGDLPVGPALTPGVAPGAGPGRPGMMQPGLMQPGLTEGFRGQIAGAGVAGAGMAGPGMPGAGSGQTLAPPKYKLLRFTDTTVEMGKRYRYRVKVVLEDPNNPYTGVSVPPWDPARAAPLRAPTMQSLSDVVKVRIRDREAQPKDPKSPPYRVESPFSEPSEVVFIPPPELFFAGKGEFPAVVPITIRNSPLPRPPLLVGNPKLNLLSVVWDPQKAVDVPGEMTVARGSYVVFTKEAEVLHPVSRTPHPIGKYDFRPEALVVDIAGGEGIPNAAKPAERPLNAPGEALVFDREGKLRLLSEADDVEGFRRYLPPPPEKPAPGAAPGAFPGPIAPGEGFQDLLAPPTPKGGRRPPSGS